MFNRLGVARIGRVGRACGCRIVNDWEELLLEEAAMDRVGTCRLGAFSPPGSGDTFATVEVRELRLEERKRRRARGAKATVLQE